MKNSNFSHIVIYKGGGYDGCFWEYNAFLSNITGKGKRRKFSGFCDLYSSGHAGIKSEIQANNAFKEKPEDFEFIVKLNNEKAIATIGEKISPSFLVPMFKKANDITTQCNLFLTCAICKNQVFDLDDLVQQDFQGYGGTAYFSQNCVCSECYQERSCPYCGEYHGDDAAKNIAEYTYLRDNTSLKNFEVYAPENENFLNDLITQQTHCCYCAPKNDKVIMVHGFCKETGEMEKMKVIDGEYVVIEVDNATGKNQDQLDLMRNDFFDENGYFIAELPPDCVQECAASGQAEMAVDKWQKKLAFSVPQFLYQKEIDFLESLGAWEKDELCKMSSRELDQKILWIASCDIKENQDFVGLIN